MRQRGDIDNLSHINAGGSHSTDSGFTSASGTFHIAFHFAQAEVISDLGGVLCSHLCGIRSVLFGTPEPHLTGG